MGNLAVTGITGKSGMYFLRQVLKQEKDVLDKWDQIHYSVRSEEKSQLIKRLTENTDLLFIPFVGDTSDLGFVKKMCLCCDTLLHIAGIHTSRVVAEGAIEANVKRMILVHTTGIYSKYKSTGEEYRKTDEIVYKLCREHDIALTILRPTMIYGNLHDGNVSVFIRMVDRLPLMPIVNGARYELQPVHCRDLGIGYYQCLMSEKTAGHDYNLSGGEPIELRKMFDIIAGYLGVERRYVSCPYPIAYVGAWMLYIVTMGRMDYREKVQRLVEPRVFSYEDANRDFGYAPVNFEIGVMNEVERYKRQNPKRGEYCRRQCGGDRKSVV